MSSQDFHIQFMNQERMFDVDFLEQDKMSSNTVVIGGRNYSLKGDSLDIEWLMTKIPELAKKSDISISDLTERLQIVGSQNIKRSVFEKVQGVGSQSLQLEKPVGKWMANDQLALRKNQEAVADKYWELYIISGEEKDHSMLLEFLMAVSDSPEEIKRDFADALLHEDLTRFRAIFRHLSFDEVWAVDSGEELKAIKDVAFSKNPVKISKENLHEIKVYMRDSNISGILMISDAKGKPHAITSSEVYGSSTSFAMHSIGKVFTGLLALSLIEQGIIQEEDLKAPIQLPESIVEAISNISTEVAEQLKNTSLIEVMLHQGRYGDYLGNYQDAIEKALEEGSTVPQIKNPEEFLKYADDKLVDLEKLGPSGESYSNLGLLLVGLSLKHLHNLKTEEKMNYQDILKKFVLGPAKIENFEAQMPEQARYNPADKVAPHIVGGPAGGYWSTPQDLLKVGEWLRVKSSEKGFMSLLEKYGGEFYRDREVSHGGSINSSSAHLSYRIDNQLTMAMMSDKNGMGKASMFCQGIQRHLLSEQ